jgi:hypothetical protein
MGRQLPRHKIPELAFGERFWHLAYNDRARYLDAVLHLGIRGYQSAPPGSAVDGDSYVVAPTGTGEWNGQDRKVAHRLDGAWTFYAPVPGMQARLVPTGGVRYYDGNEWVLDEASGGGGGGGGEPTQFFVPQISRIEISESIQGQVTFTILYEGESTLAVEFGPQGSFSGGQSIPSFDNPVIFTFSEGGTYQVRAITGDGFRGPTVVFNLPTFGGGS